MTEQQKVALVTGANKGIGFEISRQLAGQGITVLLGAKRASTRSAARSRSVWTEALTMISVIRRSTSGNPSLIRVHP